MGNELTTEKQEEKERTLAFNKLRKAKTNNQSTFTPENTENFCPGVILTQPIFKDADFTVGGCKEEIVYATTNEPQKLSNDNSEIYLLRSVSYWNWIDKDGVPLVAQVGDPAFYDNGEFSGATFFMTEIRGNNREWKFGDDLSIEPQLDTLAKNENEYRWIFNITNLRIPILSDLSLINLHGSVNLEDATNTSLLSEYITNDSMYHKTLNDLDLLIEGPYSHQFEVKNIDFVYYPGIIKHEEHHYLMKKRFVPQKLNSYTFPLIRKISLLKTEYPCPENTRGEFQKIVNHLRAGIKVGGDLSYMHDDEVDLRGLIPVTMKKDGGTVTINVPQKELAADVHASGFYSAVRARIIEWWKTK